MTIVVLMQAEWGCLLTMGRDVDAVVRQTEALPFLAWPVDTCRSSAVAQCYPGILGLWKLAISAVVGDHWLDFWFN